MTTSALPPLQPVIGVVLLRLLVVGSELRL